MNDPKKCPCGCGEVLQPYNGRRMLVCRTMWNRVPQQTRSHIMLPCEPQWKRAAVRRVFEMAREVAAERTTARKSNEKHVYRMAMDVAAERAAAPTAHAEGS